MELHTHIVAMSVSSFKYWTIIIWKCNLCGKKTEDYTRALDTVLQLPLNLYFKIKLKNKNVWVLWPCSTALLPWEDSWLLFFFFPPQHGHQTPVFTSTPSEETKESEANSCLQARWGMCFFNFAEGRKRIARSNWTYWWSAKWDRLNEQASEEILKVE